MNISKSIASGALVLSTLGGLSSESAAQNVLDGTYVKSEYITSVLGSKKPLTTSDTAFVKNYITNENFLDLFEFTETHILLKGLPIRREPLSYEEVKHIPGLILDSLVVYDKETGCAYFTQKGMSLVKDHLFSNNNLSVMSPASLYMDGGYDLGKELFGYDSFYYVDKTPLPRPEGYSLYATVYQYFSLHPVSIQ